MDVKTQLFILFYNLFIRVGVILFWMSPLFFWARAHNNQRKAVMERQRENEIAKEVELKMINDAQELELSRFNERQKTLAEKEKQKAIAEKEKQKAIAAQQPTVFVRETITHETKEVIEDGKQKTNNQQPEGSVRETITHQKQIIREGKVENCEC